LMDSLIRKMDEEVCSPFPTEIQCPHAFLCRKCFMARDERLSICLESNQRKTPPNRHHPYHRRLGNDCHRPRRRDVLPARQPTLPR
jgi:hypothetical protein